MDDWNKIMARELKRAHTGSKLSRIPAKRRPTAKSLQKLNEEIFNQIKDRYQIRSQK
ncbi:hypothetical protein IKF25_02765 [Candidatus Saccharibacteria bacterium]|nr:hypothetical protein [Candidatus Saccharibacteria bacterium]